MKGGIAMICKLEVMDYGDAIKETKQNSLGGHYPDNFVGWSPYP
jgi:hypothetical protein